jgi:hypothetical protein
MTSCVLTVPRPGRIVAGCIAAVSWTAVIAPSARLGEHRRRIRCRGEQTSEEEGDKESSVHRGAAFLASATMRRSV